MLSHTNPLTRRFYQHGDSTPQNTGTHGFKPGKKLAEDLGVLVISKQRLDCFFSDVTQPILTLSCYFISGDPT